MPERKRSRLRILFMHAVLLPTLLYVIYFFTLGPRPWTGVDEAVIEKIAKEHGREARPPLVDTDRGDLLLFIFLVGGAVAGFAAGYSWRSLNEKKAGGEKLP
jgi:cobalt/nickel transport protein